MELSSMGVLRLRSANLLLTACVVTTIGAGAANAATTYVPPGGDLQAAINAAAAGDTITLEPGGLYTGNFRLPVHAGSGFITIRSAASDASLPAEGQRISPAYAALLPKLKSPNVSPVLSTAPGAAYWRLMFLELQATHRGYYDIVTLGDGSMDQNAVEQLPHDLVLDRMYIHGDPLHGQKRGVALNSGRTTIINSYIAGIRGIDQDSIAVGGWNGPGPYLIENNYLEAAGEVILFGGAMPGIVGLVPSDVIIRRNTVTRPLSWREPVLSSPGGVRATARAGGALASGTYGYQIVARRPAYDTEAYSSPSSEVRVSVPAGSAVSISWDAVPDAAEYLIYGRTPAGPDGFWVVQGTTFTDDGAVPAEPGTPRPATVWQVKNLLELKNARRVQIDHNVFENNWLQAQIGVAILFTSRGDWGACYWCVVEDVTFEYNVIRRVGAGFNILGIDDYAPSLQANRIRIRHNEITDFGYEWGGNGYFLMVQGNPRDIVVDHNTIVTPSGGGVVQVAGPPVYGFVFTNNIARHNAYGIIGEARGPGLDSIRAFFPDAIIAKNVIAEADPALYPAGNFYPTAAVFEQHFSDYARGNFTLKPGTDWANAGTDGRDLGAIFEQSGGGSTSLGAPRNLRLLGAAPTR
jgi:hypothetical protein